MISFKKLLITCSIAFTFAASNHALAHCGQCGSGKKAEGSHEGSHKHDHGHHEGHEHKPKEEACAKCSHEKSCELKKCEHKAHKSECACAKADKKGAEKE